ncbi:MAG TPA: SDR family oxidoreductase [Pyrinomonadaceae bacterium]|nr:SDR family oxidoreductase [Pyrinomonadaceae bacterium]
MLDNNSVAVITGAASGIGRALALRLAAEKIAGIAVTDVNEAGLAETAAMVGATGVPVSFHLTDVSDLRQVQQLAEDVVMRHGRVTHLINNAGVGVMGTFEQLSIEDLEWLMGINYWGVIYGCKVFLPILKQQESAHILNVSSVFGLIAPEEQTAYCSSKFAVRGFTESLRHEMAGTNVTVQCIHPGGIKTNIARNSRIGAETPDEWKQQGAKFFDKVAKTSPETAAEVIVKGIKNNNPRILIGQDAFLISMFSRLFPRRYLSVIERLAGHKMSLRKK